MTSLRSCQRFDSGKIPSAFWPSYCPHHLNDSDASSPFVSSQHASGLPPCHLPQLAAHTSNFQQSYGILLHRVNSCIYTCFPHQLDHSKHFTLQVSIHPFTRTCLAAVTTLLGVACLYPFLAQLEDNFGVRYIALIYRYLL